MIYVILTVLAIITYLLLEKGKFLRSTKQRVISSLLIVAAFSVRALSMDKVTSDFVWFLSEWVEFFRENNGIFALNQSIGNYNVPYLYFLSVISYFDSSWDLYLIKLVSVVFDVLLAYFSMKIVSLFTDSPVRRLAAFFVVLFLPTVLINSAYWGQCDSIFTAFGVMGIYYALSGHPCRSVIAMALSFAFKLQAVFLLPVFFVLLIAKKVKIRHLFLFPATYVISVLPAVLLGRPFMDTILLYFNQATSAGAGLNYNSSSVYAFDFYYINDNISATLGICAAFLLVFAVFIIAFIKRKELDNMSILIMSLIFVAGIPFLLPHMHDRYFFMADVFTAIYAVINVKRIHLPVLTAFASLLGYYAYLYHRYLLSMSWGACALVIVLLFLLADLIMHNGKKAENSEIRC